MARKVASATILKAIRLSPDDIANHEFVYQHSGVKWPSIYRRLLQAYVDGRVELEGLPRLPTHGHKPGHLQ